MTTCLGCIIERYMMYRQCITDYIRSWIGGILGQWFGQVLGGLQR